MSQARSKTKLLWVFFYKFRDKRRLAQFWRSGLWIWSPSPTKIYWARFHHQNVAWTELFRWLALAITNGWKKARIALSPAHSRNAEWYLTGKSIELCCQDASAKRYWKLVKKIKFLRFLVYFGDKIAIAKPLCSMPRKVVVTQNCLVWMNFAVNNRHNWHVQNWKRNCTKMFNFWKWNCSDYFRCRRCYDSYFFLFGKQYDWCFWTFNWNFSVIMNDSYWFSKISAQFSKIVLKLK